jgi:hypothetical protein
MGLLYLQQGRHKEARTAWQKFVSQNFSEPFWQHRARLLLKKWKRNNKNEKQQYAKKH